MLDTTSNILNLARIEGYSVGAFNIYNLEEARAVVDVAEFLKSPVILQLLPKAFELGGTALVKLCREMGRWSSTSVAVHLDHCTSEQVISQALACGVSSIMADGSPLPYEENLFFTYRMVKLAEKLEADVEAELGRLTGTEDGMTAAHEQQLTDPDQASDFVARTGVAALAVCIGNVHGPYTSEPELDFERLKALNQRLDLPLVLHGTSGLPDAMIQRSITLGVCKFNVNTELRQAYLHSAQTYLAETDKPELVELMQIVIDGVKAPVQSKMELFGSIGKAKQ